MQCCYKVIAKLLANRLRPVLQRLIHLSQTSFVAGRGIIDNIIITRDYPLHKIKERNKGLDGNKNGPRESL